MELLLFSEDMIVYVKSSNKSIYNLLKVINKYNKVSRFKVNIQNPIYYIWAMIRIWTQICMCVYIYMYKIYIYTHISVIHYMYSITHKYLYTRYKYNMNIRLICRKLSMNIHPVLNIHPRKQDTQMANTHMKRCSQSFATTELLIITNKKNNNVR